MAHDDAGTGPEDERREARPDGPDEADPRGHREAARGLREEASQHVERGYDATQDAFVHQQRREGRNDEDDDVSPG